MAQRRIFLVRHGQTDRSRPPEDKLGNGLTAMGREQGELAGRRLAEVAGVVTGIYCSTSRRARETAEVIAARFPGVPVLEDGDLLECIPAYPRAFVDWYSRLSAEEVASGDLRVPEGMEIWVGMWERGTAWKMMEEEVLQAEAAFERYFRVAGEADEHEVIVCHGNIIRYFIMRVLGAPPELWINSDIYNCGICEVVIEGDGRIQLLSFNDSGHLPREMRVFF